MKKYISIDNNYIRIPALLWGEHASKIIIAVHGDLSHKEDTVIELLAKNATQKGYCVLSFDLPEHGDRKSNSYECNPPNCISDLIAVYTYARSLGKSIQLFACSIGAYFSLLAFREYSIKKVLFLSPVVNMEKVIQIMMDAFHVSEQKLKIEQKISLPIGKILDWDYYMYVKQHPVNFDWSSPIDILYGSGDTLTTQEEIEAFVQRHNAKLTVLENAEHYFHTAEQLQLFEAWLDESLSEKD